MIKPQMKRMRVFLCELRKFFSLEKKTVSVHCELPAVNIMTDNRFRSSSSSADVRNTCLRFMRQMRLIKPKQYTYRYINNPIEFIKYSYTKYAKDNMIQNVKCKG